MPAKPGTGSTSQLPLNEATIEALRERLYPDLERAIRASVQEELLSELAERPMPLYYDRFVVSEIRRLGEAIERNGERIDELRRYVDQRIEELKEYVDQRIEELKEYVDQRISQLSENMDQRIGQLSGNMDQRIGQLSENMDQRIGQLSGNMDQRFTAIDARLAEQKEDIFRHIDRTAFWTRVMNGAVLALLAALIAKLLLG